MLLGCALAARALLGRLLEPRIGSHPAQAAAWVAAILFPLHPAVPAALAEVASRAELAGLFLALLAGALFLRGRQTEHDGVTALALLCLLLAGLASPVTLVLAPGLALAEFCSVRRHRKRSLRIRTAVTTALVFGAAAALPVVLRARGTPRADPGALALEDELRAGALSFADELGRVATAADGLGAGGTLCAGLLLFLALHPVFRAARHAPRLWGRLLIVFGATRCVALAWASSRAHPWGSARGLLAALVWSAGLALTLTAQARPWRTPLVIVVAAGWAALAHFGARPWRSGSNALARLVAEVETLAPPRDARVLVLDPPVLAGLPPLQRDFGWLFREAPDEEGVAGAFDPRRVRALSVPAFQTLVTSEEWRAWRSERLVVLARGVAAGRPASELRAFELPPARVPTREAKPWRGLTFDPPEPIDPLWLEQVRIVADISTAPAELERLAWLTRAGEPGSCGGRVGERGGHRVAEFDLSRSLAWQLTGSVRRMFVEKGERATVTGELVARTPELAGSGAPIARSGDWSFARPDLVGPVESGARFVLALLDLESLEEVELVLEPDPEDPVGSLLARGAQRFAAAHAPLAWTLEYRVGEHALYRTRGSFP